MEIITSRANRLIVETAKLQDRKHRQREKLFFFEGRKLLEEAIRQNAPLVRVFVTEENIALLRDLPADVEQYTVSRSVYEKISAENSPEGVFCVARHLDRLHKFATIYSMTEKGSRFMAVSVRDPGNLGTIIRSARAMGIDCLLLSSDCADLYNPRTIRGAMGALFSLPTLTVADPIGSVAALQKDGYSVYATALTPTACDVRTVEITPATCFIVGNEGHGLPDELVVAADRAVIIPMQPGSESLNVAAASSLLLWEMGKILL
ncbi:MAG: RNA methyltransferase [Clostridia bacterium]|nr:RNA methyltransferase [Clostridia bacterium]